ncbi:MULTISPECIES: hypothetical protein [unclassified Mesorhizobium]|uniref:hypothetical protein n=1 Tax=unclassified Mesorhizobium TaxID=325217 RepID=UPI0003CE3C11|nr:MULTISPECIES: hypothetical protein [unclassified Mesorhizobium]ESY22419.1 hypothetical protein X751_07925 [Mesorhizobium sp. LNJC395A00]WJI78010.1 hypothetical protein NLY37_15480 [Mesorhizobium sp. C395A]
MQPQIRKKLSEVAAEYELGENGDLQDRAYRMIEYAVGRHDWYEDQRGKLFQAALGMLSFIAAAAAIVNSVGGSRYFVFFLGLGLVVLGITACRLIVMYTHVSEKNHPHRKAADIKSWYYRYTVSGDVIDDLDDLFGHDDKEAAVEDVRRNFRNFLKAISGSLDREVMLKEDLQQVFILYLLQNYRQTNLKKMYSVTKKGTVTSMFFFGLALAVLMCSPAKEIIDDLRNNVKIGN